MGNAFGVPYTKESPLVLRIDVTLCCCDRRHDEPPPPRGEDAHKTWKDLFAARSKATAAKGP